MRVPAMDAWIDLSQEKCSVHRNSECDLHNGDVVGKFRLKDGKEIL